MFRLSAICIGALCLATCQPVAEVMPRASHPVKEVVLDDLKSPWSIAFITDEDALISEKGGGLIRVNLADRSRQNIMGLPTDVVEDRSGNNGLFDVRLDPDFAINSRIYLAYAAEKNDGTTTKVIRAKLEGLALTDIEPLFEATPYTQNARYHYGGGMVFGADEKLYLTIGERLFTEADQPAIPIAQDLSDRRGKIYRLNPDGSIPSDNPDFGPDAVDGLFAVGIRAAQGLALNPMTGEIWFTEHGTHQGDEINQLRAGANYGLPGKTSGKYRDGEYIPPAMNGTTFTDPEHFWLQTVAPTGPIFYQGDEFPQWQNDLIVPGLSRGSLWRINFEGAKVSSVEELFIGNHVRSRKVAQSPNGHLYLLTDTEFKIVPGQRAVNNGAPAGQLIRIRNMAQED